MKEDELNHRIRELISQITGKENKPEKVPTRSPSKIKKQNSKIEESLQKLTICVKYAVFDLEATRRERDKLQSMLEDPPSNDSSHGA